MPNNYTLADNNFLLNINIFLEFWPIWKLPVITLILRNALGGIYTFTTLILWWDFSFTILILWSRITTCFAIDSSLLLLSSVQFYSFIYAGSARHFRIYYQVVESFVFSDFFFFSLSAYWLFCHYTAEEIRTVSIPAKEFHVSMHFPHIGWSCFTRGLISYDVLFFSVEHPHHTFHVFGANWFCTMVPALSLPQGGPSVFRRGPVLNSFIILASTSPRQWLLHGVVHCSKRELFLSPMSHPLTNQDNHWGWAEILPFSSQNTALLTFSRKN